MSNVVIIGNGPAGISTALYTTRAGIDTTIIGKGSGALEKASEIENYYGFSHPISGKDLLKNGIEGARRLGANIISDEVLGITYSDTFVVVTKGKEYFTDSVVIATGNSRSVPKIKGLKEYEESILFQDGSSLSVSGLFVAIGIAGSTDLAKKLGAATENSKIVIDENMATNVPGLFAAGDCTGGLLQISKAVYEGAKAGTEVIKYLRAKSNR